MRKKRMSRRRTRTRSSKRIARPVGSSVVSWNVPIRTVINQGSTVFPCSFRNSAGTFEIPYPKNQLMQPILTGQDVIDAFTRMDGTIDWLSLPYRYVRVKKIRWTLRRNTTLDKCDGIVAIKVMGGLGVARTEGYTYHPRETGTLNYGDSFSDNAGANNWAQMQPGVKRLDLMTWSKHSVTYGPEYKVNHSLVVNQDNPPSMISFKTPKKNIWFDMSNLQNASVDFAGISWRGPCYTQPILDVLLNDTCPLKEEVREMYEALMQVTCQPVVTLEFKGRRSIVLP